MEALVAVVCEAGKDLVDRCRLVKQCHREAAGVAQRALDGVLSLEKASSEFSADVEVEAKLIELKRTWEEARKLVEVSKCSVCYLVLFCHAMPSSSETILLLFFPFRITRGLSCFSHAVVGWSTSLVRTLSSSSL